MTRDNLADHLSSDPTAQQMHQGERPAESGRADPSHGSVSGLRPELNQHSWTRPIYETVG